MYGETISTNIYIENMIIFMMTAMLIVIAVKDARTRKIEHRDCRILCVLVLLALLSELASAQMLDSKAWFADHLIGGIVVSLPMLLLAMIRKGGLGGGDIRLMAIGGVWLGTAGIWNALCISIILAAVYAALLYLKKKDKKTQFALGPFLCAGMLAVHLMG